MCGMENTIQPLIWPWHKKQSSAWLNVWYGKHVVNILDIHLCKILPKNKCYDSILILVRTLKDSTWRESTEIGNTLNSTTIVNNSAKQTGNKKNHVKMWQALL